MKIANSLTSLLIILFLILPSTSALSDDLMNRQLPSLFSDKRAIEPGDVVTILLMEFTSGSNEATTNTNFEHAMDFSASSSGSLDFIPGMGFSSGIGSDQKSNGGTSRQGSLKGKVTARVIEILPNGMLRLEGQRTIVVNGEEQMTILSGIVRTNDVSADNTVYSYNIADATIIYRGKGVVDGVTRPGLISRFFNWLF